MFPVWMFKKNPFWHTDAIRGMACPRLRTHPIHGVEGKKAADRPDEAIEHVPIGACSMERVSGTLVSVL